MITLVGKALAKEGLVFFSYKNNSKCIGCKYYRVCMSNIEDRRRYKIIKVMDHTLPCKLHDESEANVVEIEETDHDAMIPTKYAILDATITHDPRLCKFYKCQHRNFCFAEGLFNGDKCKVIEIDEDFDTTCLNKEKLSKVKLKRITKENEEE